MVSLKPEIADVLRDINDQIGGDLDSAVSEFEEAVAGQPPEQPERREWFLATLSSVAVRRLMVLMLCGSAAVATAAIAAPTVAGWMRTTDPASNLAGIDQDAEPTQRVVVDRDTMYLEGLVPDQDVSDVLESAAISAVGRERVVNNLEISDRAVYDPDYPIQISTAEPVLFTSGTAALDDQYRPLIDLAVELMTVDAASTLAITGHTDDVGPAGANLRLSIRRAEAVARMVVEHGIDRSRLTIDGRGEAEPIDTNETSDGRAVNRRVEFTILGAFQP